jgi:hypothetical protein
MFAQFVLLGPIAYPGVSSANHVDNFFGVMMRFHRPTLGRITRKSHGNLAAFGQALFADGGLYDPAG